MAGTKKLTLAKETLRDLAAGAPPKAGMGPDNDYTWNCTAWICMCSLVVYSYLDVCSLTDGCTEGTCNSNCGQWSCGAGLCGSV